MVPKVVVLLKFNCIQMIYNRFEHSFTYSLKPIVSFSKQENNFRQNFGIFYLDNFQLMLQYGVLTLCNQLLPEVSSNKLQTLHRCYKHIEDMHLTFCRPENYF